MLRRELDSDRDESHATSLRRFAGASQGASGESARAWSELVWCENDHHSEDNTGWGYYDALHMGANGWAAAVDSAYGIVENPFIGVSGSVRVKLRVCLHPEDGPMA